MAHFCSCVGVFGSMQVYKWRHPQKNNAAPPTHEEDDDEIVERFLQRAAENSPAVRRSPRNTPVRGSELKKRNVKLPP